MNIRTILRDYHISDSQLALFADSLVTFMTRDSAEFAARGVDAAAITALGAKEDEFEAFPSDEDYKGLMIIATQAKDAAREVLEVAIRNVSDRALLKWGASSGQYRRFDVKNLSNRKDKDLHFVARNVGRIGEDYLSDLADEGLTQAMLDDLDAKTEDYEDKLRAVLDAIANRDEKTEGRVALGNQLYALVSKYCETGKVIWKETSEAKYNDYVIYPTVHSGLSKPQNVAASYDPLSPPNITLSWDAVSGATSYDVYYNIADTGAPAGEFQLLNNYAASPAYIPSIVAKRNYFKLKATDGEDTSNYSDEAYVDVPAS